MKNDVIFSTPIYRRRRRSSSSSSRSRSRSTLSGFFNNFLATRKLISNSSDKNIFLSLNLYKEY